MFINWQHAQWDSNQRIKQAHQEREHDRLVKQVMLAQRMQRSNRLRLPDLRSLFQRSPRAAQSPQPRTEQVLS